MSIDELSFIAFDLETSGKYPLAAEICEIGAVKYENGKITGKFQTLVKPCLEMGAEVIKIHGITNEMVAEAPPIEDVIEEFYAFIKDSILVAHHAPFDMGFLMPEFEKLDLPELESLVLCSSLLSRKLIPEAPNHRLQTLIKHLQLRQGTAHRASDDAEACLGVLLKCLETINPRTLETLYEAQGGGLTWNKFSIRSVATTPIIGEIIEALKQKVDVEFRYLGGSKPGRARTVRPLGLVRNPKGDFLVASDDPQSLPKRYFLDKIRPV